ncbi:MAG TPA: urease accessory protein UreD, partial [Microbacterium sp.]|uniref:urease accessory protein UreD n=1 Tax=Microbacterium sp. TaxID=51671 RepID=UPI002B46D4DA
ARVGLRGAGIVPWLVSRGPATAWVAIGAGGALLLGGDSVRLDVRVASGCTLHIEDVGGTVAYDGEGRTATWDVRASLGDGARLTWRALPFVVADGASVERSMSVTLGAGASAIVRETLVLGRAGERGGTVVSRLDVTDAGGPLLVETLRVCGDAPVPGVLGTHRVVDSVLAVGAEAGGIPAVTDAPGATVLRLERGGHLVRALGTDAHVVDLAPVFDRFAG